MKGLTLLLMEAPPVRVRARVGFRVKFRIRGRFRDSLVVLVIEQPTSDLTQTLTQV